MLHYFTIIFFFYNDNELYAFKWEGFCGKLKIVNINVHFIFIKNYIILYQIEKSVVEQYRKSYIDMISITIVIKKPFKHRPRGTSRKLVVDTNMLREYGVENRYKLWSRS